MNKIFLIFFYGRKYEELFKVKLEEYKNQNPSLTKEDNLKNFLIGLMIL